MRRNERKLGGFTLWEILIVIVVVAFFALVLLRTPHVIDYPTPTNSCIGNLRLIDGAKGQWAMEHQKQSTDTPIASDIQPYAGGGTSRRIAVLSE